MKIKIKTNYATLKVLCDLYDIVCEKYIYQPSKIHFNKDFKAAKNIIDLLFIGFKKKLLNQKTSCKHLTISLEYFQVYHLCNFLSINGCSFKSIYEQNTILKFLRVIHQEL